jgi:hypothetical protein
MSKDVWKALANKRKSNVTTLELEGIQESVLKRRI